MCSSEPFINPETPLLGDLTDLRYCLGIAIHQFEQLLCNCNGGAYRLRFERVRYIRGVCTFVRRHTTAPPIRGRGSHFNKLSIEVH